MAQEALGTWRRLAVLAGQDGGVIEAAWRLARLRGYGVLQASAVLVGVIDWAAVRRELRRRGETRDPRGFSARQLVGKLSRPPLFLPSKGVTP